VALQDGNTALHLAASKGHQEVARCLLAGGASVDAINDVRRTPRTSCPAPTMQCQPLPLTSGGMCSQSASEGQSLTYLRLVSDALQRDGRLPITC
jgi:ankyrin repeat protein